MWFDPPRPIAASLLSRLPNALRRPRPSAWAQANRGGLPIDSFLEGPCFDAAGNLFCVDIPHGRIFRVAGTQWEAVAEYEGWPNGLAPAMASWWWRITAMACWRSTRATAPWPRCWRPR
jgi:gluconolactonase